MPSILSSKPGQSLWSPTAPGHSIWEHKQFIATITQSVFLVFFSTCDFRNFISALNPCYTARGVSWGHGMPRLPMNEALPPHHVRASTSLHLDPRLRVVRSPRAGPPRSGLAPPCLPAGRLGIQHLTSLNLKKYILKSRITFWNCD